MGTSRNDRSPGTPPWKLVQAVLGHLKVPAERQNLELWRAAYKEAGAVLQTELSSSAIGHACELVNRQAPASEAVASYNRFLREHGDTGFFLDLARRALVRSVASRATAGQFMGEVFAEVVSYFASRDLPSYVGAADRIGNPQAAVSLERTFRDITKQQVRAAGDFDPGRVELGRYVGSVLATLQGGGRR